MPLPETPLVLEGGCNCAAIRYRIHVPAHADRPFYPAGGAATSPQTRMPLVCIDHCNDCRTATGAILPFWLLTPLAMVSAACVPRDKVPSGDGKLDKEIVAQAPWLPASQVFAVEKQDPSTFLAFFTSSECRRRTFCARCGTMLTYLIFPKPDFIPDDWPAMLDIVLGTVDREHLNSGKLLAPDRQMWWECGVDWIREFASQGAGNIPIHPRYEMDK